MTPEPGFPLLITKVKVGASHVSGIVNICSLDLWDYVGKTVNVRISDPDCEPADDLLDLQRDRDALLADMQELWRLMNFTPVNDMLENVVREALASRHISLNRSQPTANSEQATAEGGTK